MTNKHFSRLNQDQSNFQALLSTALLPILHCIRHVRQLKLESHWSGLWLKNVTIWWRTGISKIPTRAVSDVGDF